MFLERVAALISSHGITRNKLLHDLDLDKNSFFNWEKRGTIPSGEVLAKIADYFGVSVDYLLGQEEESERAKGFLPERLEEAMNGMSCEELYQKFHYKPKIISDYLEGKRKPLNATLSQIATDLGVNPEWLYGSDAPKYKNPTPEDGDTLSGNEKSPGTTEAAPGDARISLEESNHLLIALGLIKEGQQLSVDDLAFLTHIIGLLEAWFSKRQ